MCRQPESGNRIQPGVEPQFAATGAEQIFKADKQHRLTSKRLGTNLGGRRLVATRSRTEYEPGPGPYPLEDDNCIRCSFDDEGDLEVL